MSVRGERFVDQEFEASAVPSNKPNSFANKETPEDFTIVQNLLLEEKSKSDLYTNAWISGTKAFQDKKQELGPEYFKPGTPDECYIAVIAYTMSDPGIYSDFNRKFRELTDETSWENFGYKSFYYLLTLAFPGILNDPEPSRDLYRGIASYHFDPEPVIGDWFYFSYFASTSTDRAIAEIHLKGEGTLVEIPGGVKVAYGISKYSVVPEEKEVLVFPRNKFRVKGFTKNYNDNVDRLILEWAGTV